MSSGEHCNTNTHLHSSSSPAKNLAPLDSILNKSSFPNHFVFEIMLEVGIVTGLQNGQPRFCGSIPGRGKRFFSSNSPHQVCRPPSLQWVLGAAVGVWGWPPPSNAKVKNTWISTPTPEYALMAYLEMCYTLSHSQVFGRVIMFWVHVIAKVKRRLSYHCLSQL